MTTAAGSVTAMDELDVVGLSPQGFTTLVELSDVGQGQLSRHHRILSEWNSNRA